MIEMRGSKVMSKLVCGVGISEKGEFKRTVLVGSKQVETREYKLWRNMLQRCYSEKLHRKHPTYAGCTVSDDFKYFQRFAKWCQLQVGFGLDGYHLDKDVLLKGNKLYSEETCVFVPSNINLLLIKRHARRGEYPIGVNWYELDQKYRASCSEGGGKSKHLGYFTTPEAAFLVYKAFKETLIKRLAQEYYGIIDHRVYEALLAYEVNITD